MQTECNTMLFDFAPVEDRKVVATFDGGTISEGAMTVLCTRHLILSISTLSSMIS